MEESESEADADTEAVREQRRQRWKEGLAKVVRNSTRVRVNPRRVQSRHKGTQNKEGQAVLDRLLAN